jgi:hypothetical protein
VPGAALAKTVIINDDVTDNVMGNGPNDDGTAPGYPADLLDPTGNTVIINSGTVYGTVNGADAHSVDPDADVTASNNSVTMNDGQVQYGVTGGLASIGSGSGDSAVLGNSVTMNGGQVDMSVFGGSTYNTGSGSATASGNSATINDGPVGYDVYGGYAMAWAGDATASNNSVTMNGGTVDMSVYGGAAVTGASGQATASNNSVTMNAGEVGDNVVGGSAESNTGDAAASGNSVAISGGEVTMEVSGGYATSNGNATASGNSVSISGDARVAGSVVGGHLTIYGTGSATQNTVTISGHVAFQTTASLYGANSAAGSGDIFTGNTLNVWNYSSDENMMDTIANFENFNFVLPVDQDSMPVLWADNLYLNNGAGRGSVLTGVSTLGGTAPMELGTGVNLIQASTLDATDYTQETAPGRHGATLAYTWSTVGLPDNFLGAMLENIEAAPQTKALSEGFLSGLALLNQGGDLMVGAGLRQATEVAKGTGLGSFMALSGGQSRYSTGSHSELDSVNLIMGLAGGRGFEGVMSRLTFAAFLEYGRGSYTTYNSFAGAASLEGDGQAAYFGGGLMSRLEFAASDSGHAYAEGAARVGRIDNDYNLGNLRDAMGRSAGGFDASSSYYGLYLGGGYVFKATEKLDIDLYTRYFWTRQNSDSVTLATGDPVEFEDAASKRLRLGTRLTFAANEYLRPYLGAAWEHEFDGKASASTYGYAIDAPDLSGDTGIGEIGLTISSPNTPWSVDLGIQGYTGKREGVTGSLQLKYAF